MTISDLFLYEHAPLRKGLDALALSLREDGTPLNFREALALEIDGRTLPVHQIQTPAKTYTLDGALIVPEENEFDLCVPSVWQNLDGSLGRLRLDAARRVNYIIAKEANREFYVGFFATLKGIDHTKNNPFAEAQTPQLCDVYIYHFERDVINTALQNGLIFGINGSAVLAAKTTSKDITQSGVLTGATSIAPPIQKSASPSQKEPVKLVKAVRVMGLYTSAPQSGGDGGLGEVFWVQSLSIPYNGDSGAEDVTQVDNFKYLYANFEYLSTCTGFIDTENNAATWRIQLQKLYIVPENYVYPFEYTQGRTVRAHFGHVGEAETLPYNLFKMWTPDAGCFFGQTSISAPAGWDTPQSRRSYTSVSLGTFSKRVNIDANEIKAGARIYYGLAGEDLSITLKTSKSTIDLTEAFVAPILSNEAQQLLAAQTTSNAVSGVAAAVSVATGIVTGNPLAAIGGLLSGAQLIGELSTQKTTPYTIETDSKAFRTLYGLNGWKEGTRGGIYWERVPTYNEQVIGRYQAAFGEKFTYAPILNIYDVFTAGTRDKNCLYFKLSGGVLDADVSAEDGAVIMEAFQNGLRLWKDWRKMRVGNYGDA